jgi:hypothetical protein
VNAAPERIWAIAVDPNRLPEWQTTVVEVRDATGPLDQVGASYTALYRIAGGTLEGRWEVTRADAPRYQELTGTAPGGGRATSRVWLEPAGGATEARVEIEYELPGGFLGQFASRLFVESALERDLRLSNEKIKAIAESEARG